MHFRKEVFVLVTYSTFHNLAPPDFKIFAQGHLVPFMGISFRFDSNAVLITTVPVTGCNALAR
jgi:hypothetical protein